MQLPWWTCLHPESRPAQSHVHRRQRHSHADRSLHVGATRIRLPVRANRCRHLQACRTLASRPTPRGPSDRQRIAPDRYKKSRNSPHQEAHRRASSAGRVQILANWWKKCLGTQEKLLETKTSPSTVPVRHVRLNQAEEGGQGELCWLQLAGHKLHA